MKPLSILILFSELAAIVLVACSADEYDITKDLNDIIAETLKYFEKRNVTDLVQRLFANFYIDVYEVEPYKIRNVIFFEMDSNETSVYYGFRDNKIQIHSNWFLVKFLGKVYKNDSLQDDDGLWLSFNINIESYLLTTVYHSKNTSDPSLLREIYHEFEDVKFDCQKVADSTPSPMFEDAKSISLPLMEGLIKHNEEQNHVLSNAFDDIQPRERIISNHPTFADQEEKYYYAIPNVSIGSIDLTDIFARGLHNIFSANFIDQPKKSSLVIGNIDGTMSARFISDLGCETETSTFELTFQIDFLYITVYWDTNKIEVEAAKFSVGKTQSSRRFSEDHSLVISDSVETAIASAIMPSMIIKRKLTDSDIAIRKLELLFEKLTPTSSERGKQSARKLTKNQHETAKPYNDRTFIQNNYLTISLQPGGNYQYPQHIQCPVLNTSTFTHRIRLDSFGEISENNSRPRNLDIHFHFDFPSVNISVNEPTINTSNSNSTDSCEFQIRNDQDIKVELSSTSTNSTIDPSNQQLKMKEKINSTLLSMMKERIVRTIKPIVCTPIDICGQSVQMVDEFFQRFVSDVLKICSFRGNNKT